MPTIKGPFSFKGGEYKTKLAEIVVRKIENGEINLRLPFEADGWKSVKNYDKVKGGSKLTVTKKTTTKRKVSKRGSK